MEIVGLDHIQLAAPPQSEDEARHFYGTLLGLREIPKPPPLVPKGGCWFEGAGLQLHIGVEADFRPARKAHPAFRVADIDAAAKRLEAAGVAVHWDTTLPQIRRFFAADPFGNRLEFLAQNQQTP